MRCVMAIGLFLAIWCVWHGEAFGQPVPAVPVPTAPPPAAAPVAAPATPAGPNLWTFLCPPPGFCDKCKEKCCNCGLTQFLSASLAPMRFMTGGMFKPHCPPPGQSPADLAKAADTPGGAAARIKQEEAEAKQRRADVRFLGTVDCNRYPEAELALIKALRTDRNECVRWEAALALGNGCCCTRKTVEALLLTVNGSDTDGNPIETSPRVRHAAADALAHCQVRANWAPEPQEKPAPLPKLPNVTQNPGPAAPRYLPTSVGGNAEPLPPMRNAARDAAAALDPGHVPTGQRGLFQILMRRVNSPASRTP